MNNVDLFSNVNDVTILEKDSEESVEINSLEFVSSDEDYQDSLQLLKHGSLDDVKRTVWDLTKHNSVDLKYGFLTGQDSFHEDEPWIQTYSGKRFNPTNPIPESIVIQDIAQSLSMICRYNGHCNQFYSVAQHSVMVSYLCDAKDALWGLLHDASEGLGMCDLPAPLKVSTKFNSYKDMEKVVQDAVVRRFFLDPVEPESVKLADKIMLSTEVESIMNKRSDWEMEHAPLPINIKPVNPKEAKKMFLNRFFDLIGQPDLKSIYNESLDKRSSLEIKHYIDEKRQK